VQNRVLVTDRSYTPSHLTEAANYINQHYAGLEFDQLRKPVRGELMDLHRDISSLMQAGDPDRQRGLRPAADGVVISGGRNLLQVDDLSGDMQRLRPALRPLRVQDAAPRHPRDERARRGREDLHRRRVAAGAARRMLDRDLRPTRSTAR
jgi:transcriptional regulator of heat shock response